METCNFSSQFLAKQVVEKIKNYQNEFIIVLGFTQGSKDTARRHKNLIIKAINQKSYEKRHFMFNFNFLDFVEILQIPKSIR